MGRVFWIVVVIVGLLPLKADTVIVAAAKQPSVRCCGGPPPDCPPWCEEKTGPG